MQLVKNFRKKPVEVQAVQLTAENIDQVIEWANTIQPANKQIKFYYDPNRRCGPIGLIIPTKEGEMLCSLGDYLIKEPSPSPDDDRLFYPCKPDRFELTYDNI